MRKKHFTNNLKNFFYKSICNYYKKISPLNTPIGRKHFPQTVAQIFLLHSHKVSPELIAIQSLAIAHPSTRVARTQPHAHCNTWAR